jgi:hypothetical protein
MTKRTKKNDVPRDRNAQAFAANVICKGGAHRDGRNKRCRTRRAQDNRAIRDQGY